MDKDWLYGPLVGSGTTGVIYLLTSRGKRKETRQSKSDKAKEKELAEAKELQSIKTNLEWIMGQLGKDGHVPNGGGMMEKVNNFITEQKTHNVNSDSKLEALTISSAEQKVLLSEHFRYHEGARDGSSAS
jgi:hypothetical protein